MLQARRQTHRAPFLVSTPQISLPVVFVLLWGPAKTQQGLSVQWCHSQSFACRESRSQGSADTPMVSFFQSSSVQYKCQEGLPENEVRAAAAETAQEKAVSPSSGAHGVKGVGGVV